MPTPIKTKTPKNKEIPTENAIVANWLSLLCSLCKGFILSCIIERMYADNPAANGINKNNPFSFIGIKIRFVLPKLSLITLTIAIKRII